MRLENHNVLITGASSGIGAALAREFARQGADVALLARRMDRLHALAGELQQSGRRAVAIRCDVTSDGDVRDAVQSAITQLGHIDIVVANAGFGVVGRVEQLSIEDYRRQFETNVYGVIRTVQAVLPELRRREGRLALMGSVAGYISTPDGSPYAMSKFAVRALAESLFHEFRGSGVSVTLISPGFVDSEIRQVDNSGIHSPTTPDPIPRRFRMRTDKAARPMVRAIANRRREVVITRLGRAIVFTQRHLPQLMSAVLRMGRVKSRPEPVERQSS